jgi:hypothetical protein
MVSFKSLSPGEYVALANAVAFMIIDGKSSVDIIQIGDFVSLVGDIIVTAGAQKDRLEIAASKKNKSTTKENLTDIIIPNV